MVLKIGVTRVAFLNNGLDTTDQVCNPNTATHPSSDVDFGLMKNNKVGEHINVQFRWEVFNLVNHPNFATYAVLPDRNRNSATFGQIFGADPPRLMQLGLKLIF